MRQSHAWIAEADLGRQLPHEVKLLCAGAYGVHQPADVFLTQGSRRTADYTDILSL